MNAVRIRLVLFAVIGAVAIGYAGARYARLTEAVYSSTYQVTVELEESGGLFTGAEVTFRGVPVGRVDSLRLTEDAVEAVLRIDDDVDVPAEVSAHVHNRSAVGEQYVDLVPDAAADPAGELLADGSVIPRSDTSTPLAEEDLLVDVDRFVTTVDRRDLRVVVGELGQAVDDAERDIQRVLDGTASFVEQASAALPATRRLIRAGEVVLRTQALHGGELRRFTRNLALLSDTLVDADADLEQVLRDGGPAASELTALVTGLTPVVPGFLDGTMPVVTTVGSHLAGIEQALVAFPDSLAAAQVGVRNGQAQFSLALTPSPSACQHGYLPPGEWRSTQDLSVAPPRYDLACRESGKNYRGSAHAPR